MTVSAEPSAPDAPVESAGQAAEMSLHNRLLDQWGMAIVGGDVHEGQHLPDPDFYEGTPSRTATREATRVLESMGLVSVKRKVGATVNPADQWNIFDPQVIDWRLRGPRRREVLHELSQLREGVEPLAAQLAASNATPGDWATLTQAAITMVAHSEEANRPAYLAADELFHRTLLKASGNSMFAALGDVISSILIGRTKYELMPRKANEHALRLHSDVAALIRRGDGQGAREAMEWIVGESDAAIEQIAKGE
ncbi:FadR/GntR family transcriptional regulator [Bifidobacterium aemilianum]|nr:FCD domain-containing protein [Bifidobacterium aemilianum]